MRVHRILWPLCLAAACPLAASAADPKANAVVRLYLDACVAHLGQPDAVRAWAVERQLPGISAPAALDLFVGAGSKGAAWSVPSDLGSFAVSLRGTTEACAVWARAAEPADVEAAFTQLMAGVARPGVEVAVYGDSTTPTPSGPARALVYRVRPASGEAAYLFTMLTAEHAGGAFQASLQVARATTP